MHYKLLGNCVTLLLVLLRVTWALDFPECANVTEPDVFVASFRSCAKYVYCSGDASFEGECLGGNYFNQAQGICDDPENVSCDIVAGADVTSIFDDKFQKADNVLEENVTDDLLEEDEEERGGTGNAIEIGDVAETGAEPDAEVEVEEENVPSANAEDHQPLSVFTNPEARKCSRFSSTAVRHIPHRESCSAFFTCYNGMVIPMLCPRNLFFNAETEKCESQLPANCKLRYSVRLNCQKGVYDYMPHPQKCEYYYYCINGFLMMLRCPYGFLWHFERRTCVRQSLAKCYKESAVLMAAQQTHVYRIRNEDMRNSTKIM
ncbi:uncharacterized protein LOC133329976 [Musca vetustissima]|uniref:uncharacterized protein LOC133329976 n=1 Tax=Musca vetustissima TaxID=27455 RepID=UPI002AB626FC|nr:uncharacterized protein LOC133329976 [Musca vetustissima]